MLYEDKMMRTLEIPEICADYQTSPDIHLSNQIIHRCQARIPQRLAVTAYG